VTTLPNDARYGDGESSAVAPIEQASLPIHLSLLFHLAGATRESGTVTDGDLADLNGENGAGRWR
jgi:hypothetical protein